MPASRLIKTIVISTLGFMLLAPPLMAKPPYDKGKGNPSKEKHEDREDRQDLEDVINLEGLITASISVSDARRIAVDNNFTGYKPLPPGIRKNLARGKPLPPGIAKTPMPVSCCWACRRRPTWGTNTPAPFAMCIPNSRRPMTRRWFRSSSRELQPSRN